MKRSNNTSKPTPPADGTRLRDVLAALVTDTPFYGVGPQTGQAGVALFVVKEMPCRVCLYCGARAWPPERVTHEAACPVQQGRDALNLRTE